MQCEVDRSSAIGRSTAKVDPPQPRFACDGPKHGKPATDRAHDPLTHTDTPTPWLPRHPCTRPVHTLPAKLQSKSPPPPLRREPTCAGLGNWRLPSRVQRQSDALTHVFCSGAVVTLWPTLVVATHCWQLHLRRELIAGNCSILRAMCAAEAPAEPCACVGDTVRGVGCVRLAITAISS